jgi:hypothetical protein
MALTRGGLQAGHISKMGGGAPKVDFMFNPAEYTITKQNNYSPGNEVGRSSPDNKFHQGSPRTMNVKLYFDTYQDGPSAESVDKYVSALFKLMEVEEGDQDPPAPPFVEFKWGTLTFKARLTNLSVSYTLFMPDGTPVRATATVTLAEKVDEKVVLQTAGRAWEGRTVRKTADGSIIGMAAKFTSDPANYRVIAAVNNIENPLKVKNGITIQIPPPVLPAPPAPPAIPPPPPLPLKPPRRP